MAAAGGREGSRHPHAQRGPAWTPARLQGFTRTLCQLTQGSLGKGPSTWTPTRVGASVPVCSRYCGRCNLLSKRELGWPGGRMGGGGRAGGQGVPCNAHPEGRGETTTRKPPRHSLEPWEDRRGHRLGLLQPERGPNLCPADASRRAWPHVSRWPLARGWSCLTALGLRLSYFGYQEGVKSVQIEEGFLIVHCSV